MTRQDDLFGRNYVRQGPNGVEIFDRDSREWKTILLGDSFEKHKSKSKRYYQKNRIGGFGYDANILAVLRKPAVYDPVYDRPLSKVDLPFFKPDETVDPDFIQKPLLQLPDYQWLTDTHVYENFNYYAAERNHINNINAYNATLYALKQIGNVKIQIIDSITSSSNSSSTRPFCFYHNGLRPRLPFYFKDADEMCYFWDTRLKKPGEPNFISIPYAISRRFQNAIVFNGLRPDRDANRYGYSPFLHFRQYLELPPFLSFRVNNSYVSFVNSISGVGNDNLIISTPPPTYLTPHHPLGIIHCLFEAALLVEGTYRLLLLNDEFVDYFFIADSFRWVAYPALSIQPQGDQTTFISCQTTPNPKYTKIIHNLNYDLGEFDDLFRTAILKVPPVPPDPFNNRIVESPRIENTNGYLYCFRGYKPSFYEPLTQFPFFASREAHVRIGVGFSEEERFFYGERVSPFTGDLSVKHLNEFQCAKPLNYPSHYNLQIITDKNIECYDSLVPFVIPYRFLKSKSIRKALVFQDMGQKDFVIDNSKDIEQQIISFTESSTYNLFTYYTDVKANLTDRLGFGFLKIVPESILIKDGGKVRPIVKQIQQLPSFYERLGAGVTDFFEDSFWSLLTEINPNYFNKAIDTKQDFTLTVNRVLLNPYGTPAKLFHKLSTLPASPQAKKQFLDLWQAMQPYWEAFYERTKPLINRDMIRVVFNKVSPEPGINYGKEINSLSAFPYYESANQDKLITLISPRLRLRNRNLFYAGVFQWLFLSQIKKQIDPLFYLAAIHHDASNMVTASFIGKYLYFGESFSLSKFDVVIPGFELEEGQTVVDYDLEVYKKKV